MKVGITPAEARALVMDALMEPLGLLVFASDREVFSQAIYRARSADPQFSQIQIRQTPQGVAIIHQPRQHQPNSNDPNEE
jgi:hypothetical protein